MLGFKRQNLVCTTIWPIKTWFRSLHCRYIIHSQTNHTICILGAVGFFNTVKDFEDKIVKGGFAGGATDVRLATSEKWWENETLISRIMVAAGGGCAEWTASIGRNGGTLYTHGAFPDERQNQRPFRRALHPKNEPLHTLRPPARLRSAPRVEDLSCFQDHPF